MEGTQGAYLFALPGVAIFQDSTSLGSTGAPTPTPAHEFETTFTAGKAYSLTVGVLGGGGGMSNGATFQMSLYYRDAASNKVTVAAKTVTNTPALFPTNIHFTDFSVQVPMVLGTEAWAGRAIGIELASTVGFELLGGYWDIDNVRLTESIIPNASFEWPRADFASAEMDFWQKAPQPIWYQDPQFPWVQLMGQFLNTSNGSPNHIDNMDGEQAAYLFALPDVALSYEEASKKFEQGKSYSLTVGVLGGGGGMSNGATFELSLYYRDANSNQVTVAAMSITNTLSLFPNNTHLTDFSVQAPVVKGHEPWAGKPIGIRLASTVGFDLLGGYWDIDDVRLRVVEDPTVKSPGFTNGQFHFVLKSAPGRYEILAASDPLASLANWTSLATVTNLTGNTSIVDTNANANPRRFYFARPSP
jgi:thiamine pyrophosphokinase